MEGGGGVRGATFGRKEPIGWTQNPIARNWWRGELSGGAIDLSGGVL